MYATFAVTSMIPQLATPTTASTQVPSLKTCRQIGYAPSAPWTKQISQNNNH